jgi:myo-inositol 2-dehydrogenase/D-chiro-inositol 1-dehydrogenase
VSAPAPLRVGVVGCGTIAYWTHVRALRRLPGVALVAAADPDAAARERVARLGVPQLHAEAAALLARTDLDAVVLCPATPAHAEVALAACARRLPFYLEKPLAACAADAGAILAAAERAGVVATVGFNRRHHPVHVRARALLAQGRIGRVHSVLSAFCEPVGAHALPAWRSRRASGGGVLLDLASHHIDLVRWLLDDEVVRVDGAVASRSSEQDSAALRLEMRGGAVVQSTFSYLSGPADSLWLIGERGTLLVDRFRCALELRTGRRFGYGQRRIHLMPRLADAGWRLRRLLRPSHEPSYERALAAFLAEVRGGAASTARLLDGARSLEVVLAAEESARIGRPVTLGGDLGAHPAGD